MAKAKKTKKAENEELADELLTDLNEEKAADDISIESEPEDLVNSRVRYFRALGLLKRTPLHTIKTLQTIQRDHVNYPDSICNHSIAAKTPLDNEKTINAIVFDLTACEMHVVWGNPCANPFHTYHLNA